MAIEIVDFPIKNGDFPSIFVCLPEGISWRSPYFPYWIGHDNACAMVKLDGTVYYIVYSHPSSAMENLRIWTFCVYGCVWK